MFKLTNQLRYYMPDPAPAGSIAKATPWGAIASTAGGLAGSIISSISNAKQNKKMMEYQDAWKYREREWALQDWQMQNEYNLPANQKQRLIEAGLSPALMYGGAGGGGNMPAATVKPTGNTSYNPKQLGIGEGVSNSIMTYLAVQKQTAEIKQMELQNDLLRKKTEGQEELNKLTVNKAALTEAQYLKAQAWLDGLKQYEDLNLGLNFQNQQLGYYGTTLKNQTDKENILNVLNMDENARRELYAAKNAENIASIIAQRAIQNAKTQAEIDNIKENLKILKQSGILNQINIDGQQLLNKQFTGVAGGLLMGLLRRADILR